MIVDKTSNIKDRILQIPEIKGISKETFFEELGMSYGNFKGKSKTTPLNSNSIADIVSKYPDVNIDWLITGRGVMIKSVTQMTEEDRYKESIFGKTPNQAEEPSATYTKSAMIDTNENTLIQLPGSVAFYEDIDVTAGPDVLFTDGSTSPTDYIHVPNFQDCDVAFPIWGDSMFPAYQSGQVVLCKEFHDWRSYVPYGEVFLIITDNLRTIKYVKKGQSEQSLLLVSENTHYEPFELPKNHIRRMFFVKGSVKRNMI